MLTALILLGLLGVTIAVVCGLQSIDRKLDRILIRLSPSESASRGTFTLSKGRPKQS